VTFEAFGRRTHIREDAMATAAYKVVPHDGGWGIEHNGKVSGAYATKETAFEAIIGPASNAIKDGLGVTIHIAGPEQRDEPALGAR
jgi:hypothetical protein